MKQKSAPKTKFALALAFAAGLTASALAQDNPAPAPATPKSPPSADAAGDKPATTPAPAKKSQSDVASKTAVFGKAMKTDEAWKSALDAHALEDAHKLVDKEGAFKGTVSAVFEPAGGAMAILNFDARYRTALTAVLRKENFTNFPALKPLVGKEVLVTGKFIDYQGRAEIVLTNSAQIKLGE